VASALVQLPFVVTEVGTGAFPDCHGVDLVTRDAVGIELELDSGNYTSHNHPQAGCTYIVCWTRSFAPTGIHVVCLRDLFRQDPVQRARFTFHPAPGSLRAQLDEVARRDPQTHATVSAFLDEIATLGPRVQVDDSQGTHFVFKYERKGFLGLYPSGKITANTPSWQVDRFGPQVQDAAASLYRIARETIGVLRTREQAEILRKAIEPLLAAIEAPQ
jgi:hypothetical protein